MTSWGPIWRRLAAVVLALAIVQVAAAAPSSAVVTTSIDERGANDVPGQKDLTRHSVDTGVPAGQLAVGWSWDETSISGGNTLDGCALFDSNGNARADQAVCVTVGNPFPTVTTTVQDCPDTRVDRCGGATVPGTLTTCTVAVTATDPFAAGTSSPNDTTASCTVRLSDFGAAGATLINTCSYPSHSGSDPSDCVLVPRDAFLILTKNATPANAFPTAFPLELDGTTVFTPTGSGTSTTIGMVSGVAHTVRELVPTGWDLTGASCTKTPSGGSPSPIGTFDNATDSVTGINPAADNTVACTLTNTWLFNGQFNVTKVATPDQVTAPGAPVSFAVTVTNDFAGAVTLSALTDTDFGNLDDASNTNVTANTCDDVIPANLGPADGAATNNDVFTCTFTAQVAGAPNTVHSNTVNATMHGFTQVATETVNIVADAPPSVIVLKSVAPLSRPEPGGTFTFTVEVQNTSGEDVALTSLTDSPYGDLLNPTNTAVSNNTCAGTYRIVAMTTFRCTFDVALSAVGHHTDTVTAVVTDDEHDTATGSAQATATITDAAPTLTVAKGGPASIPETGGAATFTVDIANTSAEAVELDSIIDSVYGDVTDPANALLSANSCATSPASLAANDAVAGGPDEFSCTFTATIAAGNVGGSHLNTVTVTFDDNDGAGPYTKTDDHTVTFNNVVPTLTVAKGGPATIDEQGGPATFTVAIANTSTEAVDLTALADDHFGDLLDPANPDVTANSCATAPASLAANDAVAGGPDEFSCTFTATIAAGNAGHWHLNTVTVAFDDNDGAGPYSAHDDHRVTFNNDAPTLTVAKGGPATIDEMGGAAMFTVAIANTSVEAVDLDSIIDSAYGDLLDPANPDLTGNSCATAPAALAADNGVPGGPDEFSCTFTATIGAGNAGGSHYNTVTVTFDDNDGAGPYTKHDYHRVTFNNDAPTLTVAKTGPATIPETGAAATFTVDIANTSPEAVDLDSILDSVYGDVTDPANALLNATTCDTAPASLAADNGAPGGPDQYSCTFNATIASGNAGGSHLNTVTVTFDDNDGAGPYTKSDDHRVIFNNVVPTISVAKTGPTSISETGGEATFTVDIANTSAEAVDLDSILDSVYGDVTDPANALLNATTCDTAPASLAANNAAPGGPDEYSCTFTATIASGNAGGSHLNTVTVTFDDNDGAGPYTKTDDHRVIFNDVLPTISIAKTGPASVNEGTQTAEYTVTVVNTSTVDTVSVSDLDDSVFGDLDDGTATDCDPDLTLPATLAIGDGVAGGDDTLVCTFTATITGNAGTTHDNTVTVTFDDNDGAGPYTDTDDHRVIFNDVLPTISIAKTGPDSIAEGTQTAEYTVTVVNTSTVDTVSVSDLDDSVFGDLDDGTATDCDPDLTLPATLAIGDGVAGGDDTLVCTFTATITGNAGTTHDNTVTVTFDDNDGVPGTHSAGDDHSVTFNDVAPTISVAKGGPDSIAATGGVATFAVAIANTSAEAVDLDSIIDSVYGDVTDPANALLNATTCDTAPASLAADDAAPAGPDQYSCTFTAAIAAGSAGGTHVNTVTVTFDDNDGAGPYSAADDHSVTLTAGPPPPPPPPPPSGGCVPFDQGPVRVMGVTRIETAIASSQRVFCDGEASGVVLTRSDLFPDAQAGTPLAIDKDAAMLLTQPGTLNPATEAEILRVLPLGGTVYLLGGTAALSESVEARIDDLGYETVRYGGANRFETSTIIADQGLGNPGTLLAANGGDFPDSVVAGAAALRAGGSEPAAVILTSDENVPPEMAAYLASRTDDPTIIAIGGGAAQALPDAEALVGATRFGTSVRVAERFFEDVELVGLATGLNFADALTGGAVIGRADIGPGAMLLTDGNDLPDVVVEYLAARADTIDTVVIFGGTAAVAQSVVDEVNDALGF